MSNLSQSIEPRAARINAHVDNYWENVLGSPLRSERYVGAAVMLAFFGSLGAAIETQTLAPAVATGIFAGAIALTETVVNARRQAIVSKN